MHKLMIALAMIMMAAGPAVASDKADVVKTVNQFVDGFNKGDMKMILSSCADRMSIIDEFSPYEWHGKGACEQWVHDFDVDAKKNGITDGVVTMGKPRHVDVAGDRAYVVGAADYAFKEKGKAKKEVGSTLTVALHKGTSGWQITGWSWAKN